MPYRLLGLHSCAGNCPARCFHGAFFCACKNRFTEGIDMENTRNQTNLLSTDSTNLKREKIRTIPITLIISHSLCVYRIDTRKLKLVSLSGINANNAVFFLPIVSICNSSVTVMEARLSKLNFSSLAASVI